MSNKIIETRVIAGDIKLEWDDLRNQAEKQGLWVLEGKESCRVKTNKDKNFGQTTWLLH